MLNKMRPRLIPAQQRLIYESDGSTSVRCQVGVGVAGRALWGSRRLLGPDHTSPAPSPLNSDMPPPHGIWFLFFFFFDQTQSIWQFPGQGSNLSPAATYATAADCRILNPLHHSGNTKVPPSMVLTALGAQSPSSGSARLESSPASARCPSGLMCIPSLLWASVSPAEQRE